MSRGKYSPWCYDNNQADTEYKFNCYGETPVEWNKENYDEKLMFDNYDSEGFDSYGYSAFEEDGTYAGAGSGIDRYGYTENDYLCMSDDKFDDVCAYAKVLTEFKRNRDTRLTNTETVDTIQEPTTKGHTMNLGEVKAAFDALENNDFVFTDGFNKAHCYRGYYNEVAFEPAKFVSLAEIKTSLNAAMFETFVAWKGGEYEYDESTQVNLSLIGVCNNDDAENFEKLVSIMLNEYFDADQSAEPKKKRKTKAQKQAEAELQQYAEREKAWEEFKAEYPTRFAALLFDFHKFSATDYNLDVVRTEDNYEFCWGTSWNRKSVDLKPVPPSQQSWEYLYGLEAAEAAIQEERDRIAEAERKQRLRQAALDKLTAEEKQVLGFA